MLSLRISEYIVRHYPQFLMPMELEALRHHHMSILLEKNEDTLAFRIRNNHRKTGHLAKNIKTLELIDQGIENLYRNAAMRILELYPDAIDFHYCPSCGEIIENNECGDCSQSRSDPRDRN